jgi:NAD(P)-dependent dehydrogenase (short-subunit alcohol dehydrogenase family)
MKKINSKIAVITGASSGLGLEMSRVLATRGYTVVGTARSLKDFSPTSHYPCVMMTADVADEKQMRKLRQSIVKKYGHIDLWVNNAGVWLPHGPFESLSMSDLHRVMSVNFLGTVWGCRESMAVMRRQKFGTIVNIISTSALEGRPFSAGYCSSKFAQSGFTQSIQGEVAESGVRVLAIYPGQMKTALFGKHQPPQFASYMDTCKVAEKVVRFILAPGKKQKLIIRKI